MIICIESIYLEEKYIVKGHKNVLTLKNDRFLKQQRECKYIKLKKLFGETFNEH